MSLHSHDESVQRLLRVQIGRVQMFGFGFGVEDWIPRGEDCWLGRRVPERPESEILGRCTAHTHKITVVDLGQTARSKTTVAYISYAEIALYKR